VARIFIALCLLGAAGLGSCDHPSAGPDIQPERKARVVPDLVARVGDRGIGVSEVEGRMAADGIGAEAALEQLIDETLLVREAERDGLALDPEAERTLERLMVRALLHDLETENTPASISEKQVRDDFAAHRDQLEIPERRRSWHILVKDPSEKGRAVAESILGELRRAKDPRAVYERYAEAGPRQDGLNIAAEDLPAITVQANFEKAYKDALFAAPSEGPLQDVVKTPYGWHAIVVAEILPEEHPSLRQVESEIRERLSQQKRFERLVGLVQGLEAQGLVEYNTTGVERLLAMSALPEPQE